CKKTVKCVACLLGRWNGSRGKGLIGSTFEQHVCVINRRRGKDEWKEIKAGGFEFGSCCGYGCQDKKGMEKQHGVNIMAVEVQIGWLWTWPNKHKTGSGYGDVEQVVALAGEREV
ncbi:hypothetical protein Tco_1112867, partial [Tanacetum coccineum]